MLTRVSGVGRVPGWFAALVDMGRNSVAGVFAVYGMRAATAM
jgi:hypothetical protein